MKNQIFLAIALLSNPYTTAYAQNTTKFVSPAGCMWKETLGRCMVENLFDAPIICEVTVRMTTDKVPVTVRTTKLTIPAKMYDDSMRIKSADDDKITGVQVRAWCQAK